MPKNTTSDTLRIAVLLVATLVIVACGRLDIQRQDAAPPDAPADVADATPTPTPARNASPLEPDGTGVILVDGRPYLLDSLPGAILEYDPWVDYRTVQRVQEAYSLTRRVLQDELAVDDMPDVTLRIALDDQFNRIAIDNQFNHPAWLAGFSSYFLRDGQVADGRVYLSAYAEGQTHNVAHELTHLATPGLPTWLNEGVAEYIATRVQTVLEPGLQQRRLLDSRATVRRALEQGQLFTIEELADFPWWAPTDQRELELAYAHAWHLVEYVAREYGAGDLSGVIAAYRRDTETEQDLFLSGLAVQASTLWDAFAADLVRNLTPEEEAGVVLCRLVDLTTEGRDVSREWNEYLDWVSDGQAQTDTEVFQGFGLRWSLLLEETTAIIPPQEPSLTHVRFLDYFDAMVMVMERFAAGEISTANAMLAEANRRMELAAVALQDAFTQRPWLTC